MIYDIKQSANSCREDNTNPLIYDLYYGTYRLTKLSSIKNMDF